MDPIESTIVSDFLRKDAMEMLLGDHKEARSLLASFLTETTKTTFDEQSISSLKLFAQKLQIHEQLEEQIFYPTLKELWQSRGDQADANIIDQSLEEHHALDLIVKEIIELLTMKIGEEGHTAFNEVLAKTKALGDSLELHIAKEENEVFPKAMETFQASFGGYEGATKKLEEMGEEMMQLKGRLEQEFNSTQNLDLKPTSTTIVEPAITSEEPKEKMVEEPKEEQKESKPESNVEPAAPEQIQQKEVVEEPPKEEARAKPMEKELSLPGSKEEESSVITREEEEEEEEEEEQKAKKKRKTKEGRKAKGKGRAKKAAEKKTGEEVSNIKQAQPAKRARTR